MLPGEAQDILRNGPYTKGPADGRKWRYCGSYRIFTGLNSEVDVWQCGKFITITTHSYGIGKTYYGVDELFASFEEKKWNKRAVWCLKHIFGNDFYRLVARISAWRNQHGA